MSANSLSLKRFRAPQLTIGRFLAKRTLRMAVLWGFVFGVLTVSSALTFAKAYPTQTERQQVAVSFGGNAGFKMLVGAPEHMETVAGFTQWRVLGLTTIVGAIWGLLIATKTLRGEEDAGRWELLLSGQTTPRRATANALGALLSAVAVVFLVTALMTVGVGKNADVQVSVGASLWFSLAAVLGVMVFMAVGALASQLMPLRTRAAAMSAAIFGGFFLLRAVGDVATSFHWLVYLTPLGWMEQLRPLTGPHLIWLLPIAGLVLGLSWLSLYIAGKRDLGASVFSQTDTARPHTRLLNSPLPVAFRLTRPVTLAWLAAITIFSFVIGSLAKSTSQVLSTSPAVEQAISRTTAAQFAGPTVFLGMAFFIVMTLAMAFTAVSLSAAREDEARGYLDNLLVRSVSRLRWLSGRLVLVMTALAAIGLLAATMVWASTQLQQVDVAFSQLLSAGLNAMAPAIFLLGVGILVLGFAPRLTAAVMFGIIAWSFLVQMLGSFGNLSHWFLDTSVLHHIALAPAVSPRWGSAALLAGIGALAAILGTLRFNARDLANE